MAVYSVDQLVRDVRTRLKARQVPLEVLWGAEEHGEDETNDDSVIVFREQPNADRFTPELMRLGAGPHGKHPAQETRAVGTLRRAAVAEIRFASIAEGADPAMHRAAMNALVHQVLLAMVIEAKKNNIEPAFGAMGFVDDPEADTEYGARYAIAFTMPEVVYDTPWDLASNVTFAGNAVVNIAGAETEGADLVA